jgi:hypothetical protein
MRARARGGEGNPRGGGAHASPPRGRRSLRRRSVLVLAVLMLAVPSSGTGTPERGTAGPREFSHERHAAVPCTRCHGSGEQHGRMLVRGPADCAACHHGASVGRACAHCHPAPSLPAGLEVTRRLHLSVWVSPRLRRLPFDHRRHSAVACVECHAPPPGMKARRECGSCHALHHTAVADCAGCHPAPAAEAHPAGAHLTCAGGGCHGASVAPSATLSRGLCLTCHAEQRTHEPRESCSGCHGVPDRGVAGAGPLPSAAPEGGAP